MSSSALLLSKSLSILFIFSRGSILSLRTGLKGVNKLLVLCYLVIAIVSVFVDFTLMFSMSLFIFFRSMWNRWEGSISWKFELSPIIMFCLGSLVAYGRGFTLLNPFPLSTLTNKEFYYPSFWGILIYVYSYCAILSWNDMSFCTDCYFPKALKLLVSSKLGILFWWMPK